MTTGTGNGGFDLEGKNLTFDVVPEGSTGEAPIEIDPGSLSNDSAKKDIGSNTKETIGRYLGKSTRVNRFVVDSESVATSTATTTQNTNSSQFSPDATGRVVRQDGLRGSSRETNDPAANLSIDHSSPASQGHVVLTDVDKEPVKGYVNSVLANNRFDIAASSLKASSFVDGVITTTDDDRRVPLEPRGNHVDELVHPRFGTVTSGRLAQLGSALSIRSSAELDAASPENDPTSFGAEAKALLPSVAQSGLSRVQLEHLRARDVLESLTERSIPDDANVSIAPGGSWGSLNNVHDHFSGINSLGMIALNAALTAGVFLVYEGLQSLIDLIKVGPKALGKSTEGSYVMGRSTSMPRTDPNAFPPNDILDIGSHLGLRPTVNPFGAALKAGMSAFFGVDDSGGLIGRTLGAVVSTTQSPGFNVVVARTIIRSGLTIVDSIGNIGGNALSVVQDVLTTIDQIRSSKVITVMNVFAQLGDQLLQDENLDETIKVEGQPPRKSRIDSEDDDAFSSNVVKNRLKGSLKLAWANNRSPAMYLVPDATAGLAALRGMGSFNPGVGVQHDKARVFHKLLTSNDIQQRGARIPYDSADPDELTVRAMERKLEAEYVPFYLHDLRTNEIISFQAFIVTLTDAYQPNWESSDGFGRVDQVHVYKSTSRRVSFSFYVASTSREDFNDMWVKINKLVTMVYPQYTKGRTLVSASGQSTFVQPFSQLMSASPLVRLRIGDVIRSNYSRFALARLFGADSGDMKLNDAPIKFDGLLNEMRTKLRDAIVKKDKRFKWVLQVDGHAAPTEGLTISLPSVPGFGGSSSASFAPSFSVDKHDLMFFEMTIVGEANAGSNNVHVKPSLMSTTDMNARFGMDPDQAAKVDASLKKKYDSTPNSARRVVGGSYVVNLNALVPSFSTINTIRDEVISANSQLSEASQELAEFMNPEKNALVRSFQETRGKGLAGKIDSLDFEMSEVVWETDVDQRAPKFMRINASFTPIHDIPPGLDANGYDRAPIYPLGWHAMDNDDMKAGR